MSRPRASAYLPFRGYSAWFSSSVHPSAVRKWDQYGGTLEPEAEAQLLFSDDAFAKDTIRVYREQEVLVFLSSWVTEVLQSRSEALNVPLGKFCLRPHFRIQKSGDLFATPKNAPGLWKGTYSKDPKCENETQYRTRQLNSRHPPGGTEHRNLPHRTESSVEQCQNTEQGESSHGGPEDSSGYGGPEDSLGHGGLGESCGHGGPEDSLGHGGPEDSSGYGGPEDSLGHGGLGESCGHGGPEDSLGHGGLGESCGHGGPEDSIGHLRVCPTSDSVPDLLIECGALWEPAVGTMATTQLQDIPHMQDLPTLTLPLYDFLPRLPEFTLSRRKN